MSRLLAVGSIIFLLYPLWFRPVYLKHLLRCLKSSDLRLVKNAIHGLGAKNKARAFDALLFFYKRSRRAKLRNSILQTLCRMYSPRCFNPMLQLFSKASHAQRWRILSALAKRRDPATLFLLLRLLQLKAEVSMQFRFRATLLLTRSFGKGITPLLMEALLSEDVRIQANAVEAFGLLRDRRTVPVLLPFLQHPNHRVRANAIVALHGFRWNSPLRQEVLQALRSLMGEKCKTARCAGIFAIGMLRLEGFEQTLLSLLNYDDRQVSGMAAFALARLAHPGFVEAFGKVLLDPDPRVAREALHRVPHFPRESQVRLWHWVAGRPLVEFQIAADRLKKSRFPLPFAARPATREALRESPGLLPSPAPRTC